MGSISNGAHFFKADLHIHSYGDGGSYDVTDPRMTPQNIVDTAIKKGLSIISITDYNEIINSCTAVRYAEKKSTPFPVILGQNVAWLCSYLVSQA